MASRTILSRIGYRQRLFLLSLVLVWVVIGVMLAYMYVRERAYKRQVIESQLCMVDRSLLYAHEQGLDISSFVDFLDNYFQNSLYDQMYISVYNERDSLVALQGPRLLLDESQFTVKQEVEAEGSRQAIVKVPEQKDLFYFASFTSDEGDLTVLTAMPYTLSVETAMRVGPGFWWLALGVTVLATLWVWWGTRVLGRNISLLRQYAFRASRDEPMNVDPDTLPRDELGDIARELISLYNRRLEAHSRSEREHRIAINAIEERTRVKHQLTNNINHELKTPIGVIRGYLDTIANTPDMDDDTRNHFLERARSNVERLCSLLNDVSVITRLEDGKDNIPLAAVNLHELLFQVEDDLKSGHLLGAMTFEYDVPLDCEVMANESLLTGMLLNLVKNSVIHSHGSVIGVKLVSESSKFYVFTFYDDGVGVPQEHLSHLFERFYRVDSGRSRKAGGTGLGLPIVKKTIVALGGAVSVHNRSTGGLEFTFTLRKAPTAATQPTHT